MFGVIMGLNHIPIWVLDIHFNLYKSWLCCLCWCTGGSV